MGSSPLHIAAQQGNVTMINALLAQKDGSEHFDARTPTLVAAPVAAAPRRPVRGGRWRPRVVAEVAPVTLARLRRRR